MKIGLVVEKLINADIKSNTQTIINTIKKHSNEVDLLCFGETFLQGFDGLTWQKDTDYKIAIAFSSITFEKIKKAAKDNNVAVGFGYFEKDANSIYSSYAIIDRQGSLIYNFRRVSVGWKVKTADNQVYTEGKDFDKFEYYGKSFSIGLCGDLWDEKNIEKINSLNPEIVLWPVYVDFSVADWNGKYRLEYSEKAKKISKHVLLVNSIRDEIGYANGGAIYFKNGKIAKELAMDIKGVLVVEI